jgi:DNA-binding XRE family transcriptional regulator
VKPSRVKRELSRLVREARIASGMTQDVLAAKARTTRATVSLVERGKYLPGLVTFLRLAKAMSICPGALMLAVDELTSSDRPQEESWRR